jgi:DNA-binding NarL/FixJ family response regulator
MDGSLHYKGKRVRTIRILLADDHALVRAGIRSLVDSLAEIEVCGEASDGREALRLIKQLQPDVVLLDIAMPEMNGLDLTSHLRKDFPSLPVLILSMHATKAYVLEAMRAGASGYVLKNTSVEELEKAIRSVAIGEKYLTPAVSAQVIDGYTQIATKTTDPGFKTDPVDPLTLRQREVLQLIAEGHSTREIAEKLHLSVKTVETHRAQVMQRLNVSNVPGLVRAALRMGLVDSET